MTFADFDCGADYCVGSLNLPADLLVRLKTADSATVRVPRGWGRTVKTEISLDGFVEAYENLPRNILRRDGSRGPGPTGCVAGREAPAGHGPPE